MVQALRRIVLTIPLLLVVSFVGFVIVPNKLLAYLPLHGVDPHPRDAIVAAWVAAWFIATSVLFVRLQRQRATG